MEIASLGLAVFEEQSKPRAGEKAGERGKGHQRMGRDEGQGLLTEGQNGEWPSAKAEQEESHEDDPEGDVALARFSPRGGVLQGAGTPHLQSVPQHSQRDEQREGLPDGVDVAEKFEHLLGFRIRRSEFRSSRCAQATEQGTATTRERGRNGDTSA